MSIKKNILFLIRAYNDADIQMSLIETLSRDKRLDVRVMGYPCDGTLTEPSLHEAAPYIASRTKTQFSTVLDTAQTPIWLRLILAPSRFLGRLRLRVQPNVILDTLIKPFHLSVKLLLRFILKRHWKMFDSILASLNPDIVIMDEAIAMERRSPFLDQTLRPYLDKTKIPLIVIQTGQNVYLDPMPNKARSKADQIQAINYKKTPARHFMVSSTLDANSTKVTLPDENPKPHGNLRMGRDWIIKLHNEILKPPFFDRSRYDRRINSDAPHPRIVFMLSKIGYGIKLEQLIKTIEAVTGISGVKTAIKPHTRGMKLDFMSRSQLNGAALVTDIPSAVLIDWADLFLFTGSSIAFHPLKLGKRVGFLKHCQDLESIYDDGIATDQFQSVDDLIKFIEDWRDNSKPPVHPVGQKRRNQWLEKNVDAGVSDTPAHYAELVLDAINLKQR
jgi:hypothetical protein